MKFATKKSEIEHFRAMLHRYSPGEKIPEPDATELAELIIGRHQRAKEKIGAGIAFFTVQTTPVYGSRGFRLVRTDGTYTDVSYLKCINPADDLSNLIKALRCEVADDIQQAKNRYFAKNGDARGRVSCLVTGELITQAESHADHAEPFYFNTLATAFITAHGIEPSDDLIEPYADEQYRRLLVNRAMAQRWKDFHHSLADIRVVSRRANMTAGGKAKRDEKNRQLELRLPLPDPFSPEEPAS